MRVDNGRSPSASFESSANFVDPMLQLQAEAMAEEQNQQLADSATEGQARAEKQEENAKVVGAMRDEASAIRTGGMVSGGMTAAGGTMQGFGASNPNGMMSISGDTLKRGAEPAGEVMGKAPAKKAEADATEARNLAEQKQWKVDDAKERRQRAEKQQENAMNSIQQELKEQRETNSFILQRM